MLNIAYDTDSFIVSGTSLWGLLNKIPERKQSSKRLTEWICAATDTTVAVLHNSGSPVTFVDEIAETIYKGLLLRIAVSEKLREHTAIYKDSQLLPNAVDKLKWKGCELPYQRLAALNIHHSDGYALFMEQGTGKTLCAISAMRNIQKPAPRVLIVCPKNVRANWANELQQFVDTDFTFGDMRGSQIERLDALINVVNAPGLGVAVIGYDSLQGSLDALRLVRWDLGILDESHYIKNNATKRWKQLLDLRDHIDKRVSMSGTPIANTMNDLWTQLEWLGKGFSGFNTFKGFKYFYNNYDKTADGSFEFFLGLKNVPLIKDRLSRYTFVITKKEALPYLPEKVYDIEEVEMVTEQAEAYNKLCEDLTFEIDSAVKAAGENQALVVNNVLTMLLKLAQITSGFLIVPGEKDADGVEIHSKKLIRFEPNPKLERLMEILKEKGPNQKTIVWAHFVYDQEKILAACKANNIKAVMYGGSDEERDKMIYDFNHDRSLKVVIASAGKASTGTNMLGYPPGKEDEYETNCDHAIYYSQDWSSVKRAQSEDRANRKGSRCNLRVTDLVVPKSIDTEIRDRVTQKRKNAFEITDLRDLLKAITLK